MDISTAAYVNLKVNDNNRTGWLTYEACLVRVGERGGLCGVNHYKKRNLKGIVDYYVKRIASEHRKYSGTNMARYATGKPGDKFNVVITLHKYDFATKDYVGEHQINIPLECR